jgi:hypothetical protein
MKFSLMNVLMNACGKPDRPSQVVEVIYPFQNAANPPAFLTDSSRDG